MSIAVRSVLLLTAVLLLLLLSSLFLFLLVSPSNATPAISSGQYLRATQEGEEEGQQPQSQEEEEEAKPYEIHTVISSETPQTVTVSRPQRSKPEEQEQSTEEERGEEEEEEQQQQPPEQEQEQEQQQHDNQQSEEPPEESNTEPESQLEHQQQEPEVTEQQEEEQKEEQEEEEIEEEKEVEQEYEQEIQEEKEELKDLPPWNVAASHSAASLALLKCQLMAMNAVGDRIVCAKSTSSGILQVYGNLWKDNGQMPEQLGQDIPMVPNDQIHSMDMDERGVMVVLGYASGKIQTWRYSGSHDSWSRFDDENDDDSVLKEEHQYGYPKVHVSSSGYMIATGSSVVSYNRLSNRWEMFGQAFPETTTLIQTMSKDATVLGTVSVEGQGQIQIVIYEFDTVTRQYQPKGKPFPNNEIYAKISGDGKVIAIVKEIRLSDGTVTSSSLQRYSFVANTEDGSGDWQPLGTAIDTSAMSGIDVSRFDISHDGNTLVWSSTQLEDVNKIRSYFFPPSGSDGAAATLQEIPLGPAIAKQLILSHDGLRLSVSMLFQPTDKEGSVQLLTRERKEEQLQQKLHNCENNQDSQEDNC